MKQVGCPAEIQGVGKTCRAGWGGPGASGPTELGEIGKPRSIPQLGSNFKTVFCPTKMFLEMASKLGEQQSRIECPVRHMGLRPNYRWP